MEIAVQASVLPRVCARASKQLLQSRRQHARELCHEVHHGQHAAAHLCGEGLRLHHLDTCEHRGGRELCDQQQDQDRAGVSLDERRGDGPHASAAEHAAAQRDEADAEGQDEGGTKDANKWGETGYTIEVGRGHRRRAYREEDVLARVNDPDCEECTATVNRREQSQQFRKHLYFDAHLVEAKAHLRHEAVFHCDGFPVKYSVGTRRRWQSV
mmetsp:Transcript_19709/g.53105  ORF Transcript_19709/g.53105 Transcript_19709/m.53105 type:complete len:212 (+) Transcript_19709:308-943(+)